MKSITASKKCFHRTMKSLKRIRILSLTEKITNFQSKLCTIQDHKWLTTLKSINQSITPDKNRVLIIKENNCQVYPIMERTNVLTLTTWTLSKVCLFQTRKTWIKFVQIRDRKPSKGNTTPFKQVLRMWHSLYLRSLRLTKNKRWWVVRPRSITWWLKAPSSQTQQ